MASSRSIKRLYRLKEASEYLSHSTWKIRQLVAKGLLTSVQDGENGILYFDVNDLDALIERMKLKN